MTIPNIFLYKKLFYNNSNNVNSNKVKSDSELQKKDVKYYVIFLILVFIIKNLINLLINVIKINVKLNNFFSSTTYINDKIF